jgi:hypothetical protein
MQAHKNQPGQYRNTRGKPRHMQLSQSRWGHTLPSGQPRLCPGVDITLLEHLGGTPWTHAEVILHILTSAPSYFHSTDLPCLNHLKMEINLNYISRARDSSDGIATIYGLDGPRIESRWEARFSAPSQTGPGSHPASYTMGTGSFPWAKRPGCGVNHSHRASRLKKEYNYTTPPPCLHGRL